MDHHSSRRLRSPPFGYEPRHTMSDRDYEGQYSAFDHPSRQHPMPPISGVDMILGPEPPNGLGPSFMVHSQRHSYPTNYRENRLPSTYRQTIRESYPSARPLSRANSPSYKILCITNINNKIDDLTVKNALMSDFSRSGDISVSICHDSGERLAYIYFKSYEEAREARMSKARTLFFDRPLEIEPIYEANNSPIDGPSPPPPYPQAMIPPQPSVYSPSGRRSMTPPEYQYEMNGPLPNLRRHALPQNMQNSHNMASPISINHRPLSPSEYPPPHAGYVSHGHSPPPIEPSPGPTGYDRRSYEGHYMPPAHMSPYDSPSHDSYRSSYPPGQQYGHSQYIISGPQPQQPPMSRMDRERFYMDSRYTNSRSPHTSEPYYPSEHRGPPVSLAHHSSSKSSGCHKASPSNHSTSRVSSYQQPSGPAAYRHRPMPVSPTHHHSSHQSYGRPNPPMRYMSREFRRERYGISDPQGGDQEDGRPSRVLLVNNIDSSKTEADLRDIFEALGIIEEIEVKKVNPKISSALIRFSSMDAAYKAKTANHGRYIGHTKCSIVYGKISASRRLWIGGLSSSTTVRSLEEECSKYGDIVNMEYTSGRPYCYVEFKTPNRAQFAAFHLRSTLVPAPDRKIRIEFVDPERSEKMSRHDANSQTSEIKSRPTNESWMSNERDTSPSPVTGRKRSISPPESSTKRLCPVNDVPLGANTFKHERLAAAAAAKARSSSTASPLVEKASDSSVNQTEFNNNSTEQLGNGNPTTNTSQSSGDNTRDCEYQYETPNQEMLTQCSSVREIVSFCPVSWPCQIALRNFLFPSKFHLFSGNKHVVDKYLAESNEQDNVEQSKCPLLRITQRWRLHPQPKLEEVKKRMQSGNLGMLIITSRHETPTASSDSRGTKSKTDLTSRERQKPLQNGGDEYSTNKTATSDSIDKTDTMITDSVSGLVNTINAAVSSADSNSSTTITTGAPISALSQQNQSKSTLSSQCRPLRNLISYLEQKDAAGVITLSASDASTTAGVEQASVNSEGASKLLYTFPPGEFALNLIKGMASNLLTEVSKEEFLLGVIVGSNVEVKS